MKVFYLKTSDHLRKSLIISYFLNNPNLLKLYDFEPEEFIEDVFALKSELQNRMHANEFIQLTETPRNIKELIIVNSFVDKNPHKIINQTFYYYLIVDWSKIELLKNKFESCASEKGFLDLDQILSFIEDVHRDLNNIDLLNTIAYYVDPINRIITVSNILLDFRAEVIYHQKTGHLKTKMSFEKNTWQDFEEYFFDYSLKTTKSFKGIVSYAVLSLYKDNNSIEFEHFDYIRSIFNSIIELAGFIQTSELLLRIRNDEYLSNKMNLIIRNPKKTKSGISSFENETLSEVLDRIEAESESYIDFNEFQQYFTRRGFPMFNKKTYPEIHQRK